MKSKVLFIFLILSFANSSNAFGVFFGIGPGYNTKSLDKWIDSYHLGANFGFEIYPCDFILRFGYNPETSGSNRTSEQIYIDGNLWPQDIQVNFEAFQVLLGYPIIFKRIHINIYSGISFCWLDVPNEYKDDFKKIGSKEFSTDVSPGPTVQISFRYLLKTYSTYSFSFFSDLGFVHPRFDSTIDSELTGDHYYYKFGFSFGLY